MGRLPSHFAGRLITEREPYNIPGELIMQPSTSLSFPANTFDHNIDKPFEMHRMIPRVTALDEDGIVVSPQPDQEELQALVRLRVENTGRNTLMQKASQLMHLYTKGSSERTWEWADPYYMIRGEGLNVAVDTQALPVAYDELDITQLRIEINFQGFEIVIAPPSENR
jgi:hypothetical protein